MAIIVTGTPGTGKTTFAKQLAQEKQYDYVDLREFAAANGCIIGRDEARDADIIDEEKVVEALQFFIKVNPNIIIDGHFSHELPPASVEKCYVTRCDISVLHKRLEERGYKLAKIEENVQAEIFDTCGQEARDAGHVVEEIRTG